MSTAETCNALSFQDSHSQHFFMPASVQKWNLLEMFGNSPRRMEYFNLREISELPKALHVKTALNNDMLMLAL